MLYLYRCPEAVSWWCLCDYLLYYGTIPEDGPIGPKIIVNTDLVVLNVCWNIYYIETQRDKSTSKIETFNNTRVEDMSGFHCQNPEFEALNSARGTLIHVYKKKKNSFGRHIFSFSSLNIY